MKQQLIRLVTLGFCLVMIGTLSAVVRAQLPTSYAGIWLGMEEPLVYTMLEKNGWPYVIEDSQRLRISLNSDYLEAFTIHFIGRKVHRIHIIYKTGIENYGNLRFPDMEALLLKKYGKYKDRNNWSTLNDRGETISHVRWVWESSAFRFEFRGRSSDVMDKPDSPIVESHAYSCDIILKDVEIFLERSRKEITNLEKLPSE